MENRSYRPIEYLRLSVTDRCNLRCCFCMPQEGVPSVHKEEILSLDELYRIAQVAARLGVRKIRLAGREPLTRPGMMEFIRRLAVLPGRPEISLTTNGLQLADLAGDLKAAGLSRVNVNLDTLRPERFRNLCGRDELERVLTGIEEAQRKGLTPIKINTIPIRGVNEDEIVEFARLTLRHPWEVRFLEFRPISEGCLDYTDYRVPASVILAELSRLGILLPLPRGGAAHLFHYAGSIGIVGVIPPVSGHNCGECNRLRITADGRIRPCLFSPEEIDVMSVLRNSPSEEPLEEILQSAGCAKPQQNRYRFRESEEMEGRRSGSGALVR